MHAVLRADPERVSEIDKKGTSTLLVGDMCFVLAQKGLILASVRTASLLVDWHLLSY